MDKETKTSINQRFISLLEENKNNGIGYTTTAAIAKIDVTKVRNILDGKSSANETFIEKVLIAFPDLDPDNKNETIKEQLNRVDKEMEELKAEFAKQQAIWDEKSKILDIAQALAKQLEEKKND